jgi:hypothetical protein
VKASPAVAHICTIPVSDLARILQHSAEFALIKSADSLWHWQGLQST